MRGRRLAELFLLVLACIASGVLECRHVELTPAEARGRTLYGQMCAVCHGPSGEGYAADRAPALSHPDFLASASDELLRKSIADGRPGTTMSAWSRARGGPLDASDTDALVAFLRTWQRRPSTVLDERPLNGDSARGAPVFARECAACHGPHGVEGPEVHVGSYGLLDVASNGFLREAIGAGRAGTPMRAFGDVLGDGGIDDAIAVLRRVAPAALVRNPWPAGQMPPIPLGPVPLNPRGPEPQGFQVQPATTPVDRVKAQLDRGARMAILDARAPSDYADGHIAGAVSVPFYDPTPYLSSLPANAWLVCYCACPHAESGELAAKLVASHFAKVTVLDEGLWVWKARGYPVRSGIDP
jgi:cytochrome c oxidase cbb3-type subunit 3/ubiquinol-cytochrome c reductase cytochrome c subunit